MSRIAVIVGAGLALAVLGFGVGDARAERGNGAGDASKSDSAVGAAGEGNGAVVGDGEIVGVLSFQTSGLSKTAAKAFEKSIEDGLTDNGYKVAPRSRMTELLGPSNFAAGCKFGPCLREVYRNTEVRWVLVVDVSAVGPAYTLITSLLDTRSGRIVSQLAERCEVCTIEEAITTATLGVVSVTQGAGAAIVDPAMSGGGPGEIADFKTIAAERDVEIQRRRRRLRQSALFFFTAAVLAGGAGAYFVATDERERGLPAIGVGGAFAVASGTLLVLSRRF